MFLLKKHLGKLSGPFCRFFPERELVHRAMRHDFERRHRQGQVSGKDMHTEILGFFNKKGNFDVDDMVRRSVA